MQRVSLRFSVVIVFSSVLAGGTPVSDGAAVAKVLGILGSLQRAQQRYQRVSFQLSESEINDYSAHALAVTPRPGVRSVRAKLFSGNYISTFTVLDFDAVGRWKPGTVPVLLRPVLNGQKTIWLDLRFQADKGRVSFTVEKAYFQNIRLPAVFVQKLIEAVAARQPEHYDAARPLPLPFGLQKIWTNGQVLFGEN